MLSQERHKFSNLDSLRTILALSVACGHFVYWNSAPFFFPRSFFLAVDFFFILSGFVLTQSIYTSPQLRTSTFMMSFAIRRLFRLAPLYFALFLPSLAISMIGQHPLPGWRECIVSLLLLQGTGLAAADNALYADSMVGISWSISVELWVGILFFPIVYALRHHAKYVSAICMICAGSCLAMLLHSPNGFDVNLQRFADGPSFGVIRGLLGISLGAVSWIIFQKLRQRRLRRVLSSALEMMIIGFLVFPFWGSNYNYAWEWTAPFTLSAMLIAIALNTGAVGEMLNQRVWEPVRPLSFSIYLVHPFIIFLWRLADIPFNTYSVGPFLLVVVLIAALLFRFVEHPFIKLGRSLSSKILAS